MKYFLPIFLFFSACMVGPKYQSPQMHFPCNFEENKERSHPNEDLCHWWQQFQDPLLNGLIAEALQANYDLRLAIEKIEQTRAQFRIERSYLWPEIDLNASATRTKISQNLFPAPSTPLPGNDTILPRFLNLFQFGFDAIWELDFWGKFRHLKNAAYSIWEATIEDSQNVLISMVSEVALNYTNIRALQKKIELIKRKIEVDAIELKIVEELYQVGIDNETQVTTLISAMQADLATLPVLETSLKQTVYALAVLLGRQPEGLMECLQEPSSIPMSINRVPVGLPSDLLRRRPDVRSAERQLAASTEQIGAAIADYFPHIALTGISFGAGNRLGSSVGWLSDQFGSLFDSASRTFSVGVGINWALIDFGRIRAQVDVQKSLQRQALLTYEKTVITSLKEVESALIAYFEEQNRYTSLQTMVWANQRTLDITAGLNRAGLANELQVISTQKALIDAESSFIDSQQALTGDLIALYKAVGGDWLSQSAEEEECNGECK